MTALSLEVYIGLVLAGLLMVGIEIYIPGGVVGLIGGCCLVAAIAVGFAVFDPPYGMVSAGGILMLSLVGLYVWATFVPRTGAGKRLTLARDGSDFRLAHEDADQLSGQRGTAISALRPSGVARLQGRRRDVVTEDGIWIEAGAEIEVVSARGARIVVRPARPANPSGAD